jgi:hypothetical protein
MFDSNRPVPTSTSVSMFPHVCVPISTPDLHIFSTSSTLPVHHMMVTNNASTNSNNLEPILSNLNSTFPSNSVSLNQNISTSNSASINTSKSTTIKELFVPKMFAYILKVLKHYNRPMTNIEIANIAKIKYKKKYDTYMLNGQNDEWENLFRLCESNEQLEQKKKELEKNGDKFIHLVNGHVRLYEVVTNKTKQNKAKQNKYYCI